MCTSRKYGLMASTSCSMPCGIKKLSSPSSYWRVCLDRWVMRTNASLHFKEHPAEKRSNTPTRSSIAVSQDSLSKRRVISASCVPVSKARVISASQASLQRPVLFLPLRLHMSSLPFHHLQSPVSFLPLNFHVQRLVSSLPLRLHLQRPVLFLPLKLHLQKLVSSLPTITFKAPYHFCLSIFTFKVPCYFCLSGFTFKGPCRSTITFKARVISASQIHLQRLVSSLPQTMVFETL